MHCFGVEVVLPLNAAVCPAQLFIFQGASATIFEKTQEMLSDFKSFFVGPESTDALYNVARLLAFLMMKESDPKALQALHQHYIEV